MNKIALATAIATIVTITVLSTKAEAAFYVLDYENCATTASDGTLSPAVFPITSQDQMGGVVVSDTIRLPGVRYIPRTMITHFDMLNRMLGPDDLHKCATFTGHMEAMS